MNDINNKKIFIIDHAGHTSQFDLALTLAKNNFKVFFAYTKNLSTPNAQFIDHPNLEIIPIDIKKVFNKYNYFVRIKDELKLGLLQCKSIHSKNPFLVQSANNPLLSQLLIIIYCRINNIKFINWITDLLGVGIYNTLKRKSAILSFIFGNLFLTLEKLCSYASNWNITIASTFENYLRKNKIKNVSTVQNWAPLKNVNKEQSNFFKENNLTDKKVLLFSGTLGKKHSVEILFDIAKNLDSDKILIVITNPEIVDNLNQLSISKGINLIKFFPFQPASEVYQIFKNSYLLINILNDDSNFSVPSKVLSYIVASRPMFLVMAINNEISQIVLQNELGVVVSKNDSKSFYAKLNELLINDSLRKKFIFNCKKFSKDNFDSVKKMNEFIDIYKKINHDI